MSHHLANIPVWAAAPFVLLLFCIAICPLISHKWWNKFYPAVSVPLGIITVVAYFLLFGNSLRISHTALEYISFIALLASLFVVSGGILIRIEGRATPIANLGLLAVGAILANIIGTTGASMLLIRPFLHLNRARLKSYLIVFFIFIVSNVGGTLTPIGDPPLFLGYLKGVPFFWVMTNVWHVWLFTMLLIFVVFMIFDLKNRTVNLADNSAGSVDHKEDQTRGKMKFVLKCPHNFLFLGVIIFAVFKPTPLRELLMLAAALASWFTTPRKIHHEHHFTFAPIKEVAILFFGIFATMMPALDWLEANAANLGISSPSAFYWAVGTLSSFLDNAPTYLSFLSASMGLTGLDVAGVISHAPRYLIAISLASVYFGACTYIGNGPNFMVKSIVDHRGVKCPTFLGYIFCFSLPILIPIFFLTWFVFLR